MNRSFLPGDRVLLKGDYEEVPHDVEARVVEPPFDERVKVRLNDGRVIDVRPGDLRRADQ